MNSCETRQEIYAPGLILARKPVWWVSSFIMFRLVRVSPRVRLGMRMSLSNPCFQTTRSGVGVGGGIDGEGVAVGAGEGKCTDAGAGSGGGVVVGGGGIVRGEGTTADAGISMAAAAE